MSIDLKIQNKCDHVINWERLSFENDGRTVFLLHPVASIASFKLRINNVLITSDRYAVKTTSGVFNEIPTSSFVLKERTRLYNPLVEAQYTTYAAYCPKCAGVRYLDDIQYNLNKDAVTVKDELLLIQTFEKHIITRLNSNKYHTWIGTQLAELTKSKISDIALVTSRVRDEINKATEDLKKVQRQYQTSGRKMSTGELFGKLLEVEVKRDEQEPTTIQVVVRFTSQSGRILEYEQLLEFTQLRLRAV